MKLIRCGIALALSLSCVSLLAVNVTRAADVDTPKNIKAAAPVKFWPFFIVNDNRFTYSYNMNGSQPGEYTGGFNGTPVNPRVNKNVFAFTHFDIWAYGTNTFNFVVVKSDHTDAANPCVLPGKLVALNTPLANLPAGNCAGMTDAVGTIRSTFGFNEITGTKMFSYGPLHNVSLELGADVETNNSYTGSSRKDLVAGLQFQFDLPYKGYFNFAPLYYKEVNHNSYVQCGAAFVFGPCVDDGNKEYRGTWAVETNWYMDLGFLPENMQYFAISGRASWIGQKGSDKGIALPNSVQTAIEFNSEPIRLTFDASKMALGPAYSHQVDLWVAYRYWQNKYGYDHANAATCSVSFVPRTISSGSCTESSLNTGVTVKF